MIKRVVFHIEGLDCASCVIDIDGALEDSGGVQSAKTSFAKGQTEVIFEPEEISEKEIIAIIARTGYSVSECSIDREV